MGKNTENVLHIRHRQPATGLLEYSIQLHYGDGVVDTWSPTVDVTTEAALAQASGSAATFGPVALAAWGDWWQGLPSLPTDGPTSWRELVRQDYAVPL